MKIQKATRKSAHLIISLTGPSGSGKTKSALRLAEGLGGKTGFIDTESGRAGLYADEHNFDVIELESPFTPERYIEALRKFEDAGYGTVVIDSASHEWEGIGGVLDFADSQKNRQGAPLQGLLKWKEPKAKHKKFVAELLRTKMHLIICLRAKSVFEQRRGASGKDEIVMTGYREVAEQGFIYEMTASAILSNEPGRQGFPSMTKCPDSLLAAFPDDKRIDEETGRQIAAWLGALERDPELEKLQRDAGDEAEKGLAALEAFWKSLSKKQQLKLKPFMEGFKAKAAEADAQPTGESTAPANLEDPFSQAAD